MYPPPNLLGCSVFCISYFCVFFTFSPQKKAINCFFLTKRGRGNPRQRPESGRQRQSQTPATYRGRGIGHKMTDPPDSGKNRPGQRPGEATPAKGRGKTGRASPAGRRGALFHKADDSEKKKNRMTGRVPIFRRVTTGEKINLRTDFFGPLRGPV